MNSTPRQQLDNLRSTSWKDFESYDQGKVRVAIQIGHCSTSVGSARVAQAISDSLPDSHYVVVTGCDGACFNGPQVLITDPINGTIRFSKTSSDQAPLITRGLAGANSNSIDFFKHQKRVSLDLSGTLDPSNVKDYIRHNGYNGLVTALEMSPEEVIAEVESSGLRGRGGAYFPAALKWRGSRKASGDTTYLVINAEEGEPGVFKDRHLMEGVPYRILEGAVIAGYASGASRAFIYINAEAELSAQRMELAVRQSEENGLLGDNILGSGYSLRVEICRGAGGYVCGEETTLLNTVEGYRREPRIRPPFPTESGLWANPTVINNPETLASIPFILSNGASVFNNIGVENATGTKLVSVSGAVRNPGVAEVPMGTSLEHIIMAVCGGPPEGSSLRALAVGGPSSGILPVDMMELSISPGLIHPSGIMLGAGGIIALDQDAHLVQAVRSLAAYNAAESCGKCTPCREGTPRMVNYIDQLSSNFGDSRHTEELRQLAYTINQASLCGLGQAAGNPIISALELFPDLFEIR